MLTAFGGYLQKFTLNLGLIQHQCQRQGASTGSDSRDFFSVGSIDVSGNGEERERETMVLGTRRDMSSVKCSHKEAVETASPETWENVCPEKPPRTRSKVSIVLSETQHLCDLSFQRHATDKDTLQTN